ncbi:MAG: ABC transporter substrate-binding protein [Chloroflexi bacterium]|nr:ABC transporter substrate-binding protein [Chloroflexota bacterium]
MLSVGLHRVLILIALLSVLLASCAPPAPGGNSTTSAGGIIKVGLLAPVTGQGAASGQDMVNGWNLWWKLNGNKLCSGKTEIQTVFQDTASVPDTARNKARFLVEQSNVPFIVGPLFANEALAVATYTKAKGIPIFWPVPSNDDFTQRQRSDLVIRIAGWTSSQPTHPFADWIMQQHPNYKKFATIAADFIFGYESVGGFVNVATLRGAKIVKQVWNPTGTSDFSPYLPLVANAGADAVFATEVVADAPRFVKAWSDFGYKNKIPLFTSQNTTDQSQLRSMGSEAEGIISAGHYAEGRDDPATQSFVQAFDKAYGQLPSYYAAALYTAAQWLSQGIEAVGCNISNQAAFLKAVRSIKLADSAFGPMSLDSYGNPIENIYIRKVVRRPDGRLWNVPIQTIPNVSQFYNFDPAQYLAHPPYTRDYKGVSSP